MSMTANDWTGQVVGQGRYLTERRLGEGGMALVYLALDQKNNAEVVIKAPRAEMMKEPDFAARFVREVRALVKLKHPHIVSVFDVNKHEEIPFMVMQYLPGGTLRARQVRDAQHRAAPMPADSLKSWLAQVASALDYIHGQGYLHRDVKPDNLLFDADGTVYLGDFGVAKVMDDKNPDRPMTVLTQGGQTIGTPQYMAPELILAKSFDHQVDQYALAVTVFELLSGRYPYEGSNPTAIFVSQVKSELPAIHEIVKGLSPELTVVLKKAMAKNPKDRFPTCAAFAKAALAAAGKPGGPPPLPQGTTTTVSSAAVATPVKTAVPVLPGVAPVRRPGTKPRMPAGSATPATPSAAPKSKPEFVLDESALIPEPKAASRPPVAPKSFWRRPLPYILIASGLFLVGGGVGALIAFLPPSETAPLKTTEPPASIAKIDPEPTPLPSLPPTPKVVLLPKTPVIAPTPPPPPPKPAPQPVLNTPSLKLVAGDVALPVSIQIDRPGWEKNAVRVTPEPSPGLSFDTSDLRVPAGKFEGTIHVKADADAVPRTGMLRVKVASDDVGLFQSTLDVPVTIVTPTIALKADRTSFNVVAGGTHKIPYSIDRGKYKGPVELTVATTPESNGLEIAVNEREVVISTAKASHIGPVQVTLTPTIGRTEVGLGVAVPGIVEVPPVKIKSTPGPQIVRIGETLRCDVELERGDFLGPVKFVGKSTIVGPQVGSAPTMTGPSGPLDGVALTIGKETVEDKAKVTVQMQIGGRDVGSPFSFDLQISPPIFDGPFPYRSKVIYAVAFSSDGQEILTGRNPNQNALLWDAVTGRIKQEFVRTHPANQTPGFSPSDPDTFVEFGRDFRTIRTISPRGGMLWNLENGQEKQMSESLRETFPSLGFNRDGTLIVTGNAKGEAVVFEAKTGKERNKIVGPKSAVTLAAFGQDDMHVVLGYENGTLILYHRVNGKVATHENVGRFVRLTPDGKRVFVTPTNRADREAHLVDLVTGRKTTIFRDPRSWDVVINFSADERKIITGSQDGTVALRDVETGKTLRTFSVGEPVTAVAISPDLRNAIVATRTGKLLSWDFERTRVITPAVMPVATTSPPSQAIGGEGPVAIPQPAPPQPNPPIVGAVGHLGAPNFAKGATYFGQLTFNAPRDPVRGTSGNILTVDLKAGSSYVIEMKSVTFDTFLRLENPNGIQVAVDDDSGDGTNSRIVYTCPTSGRYRVIATAYRNSAGLYSVVVNEQ